MKKIILFTTGCFFTFRILAQDIKPDIKKEDQKVKIEKYCAVLKGENIVVVSEEKEVTSDIILTNGTQIKTTGSIIKPDGTKIVLKNAECVDKEGNIVKSIAKDKIKNRP